MKDPEPQTEEHDVTDLPEPDVPVQGEIDPTDAYVEGVDREGVRDGEAGD